MEVLPLLPRGLDDRSLSLGTVVLLFHLFRFCFVFRSFFLLSSGIIGINPQTWLVLLI